ASLASPTHPRAPFKELARAGLALPSFPPFFPAPVPISFPGNRRGAYPAASASATGARRPDRSRGSTEETQPGEADKRQPARLPALFFGFVPYWCKIRAASPWTTATQRQRQGQAEPGRAGKREEGVCNQGRPQQHLARLWGGERKGKLSTQRERERGFSPLLSSFANREQVGEKKRGSRKKFRSLLALLASPSSRWESSSLSLLLPPPVVFIWGRRERQLFSSPHPPPARYGAEGCFCRSLPPTVSPSFAHPSLHSSPAARRGVAGRPRGPHLEGQVVPLPLDLAPTLPSWQASYMSLPPAQESRRAQLMPC
ncbi:hypothetical protein E2320_006631, partial [Naja naja]